MLFQKGPRPAFATSGLEEKFHLDAGELDHVVILERVRGGTDLLAVHLGALVAFDMGDEVALRPARQHRHLHPGLAERGERLVQLELLAGVAAREQLDRAERLAAGLGRSGRRGSGFRVLVGHAGGLGARARGLHGGGALRDRGGLAGGGGADTDSYFVELDLVGTLQDGQTVRWIIDDDNFVPGVLVPE